MHNLYLLNSADLSATDLLGGIVKQNESILLIADGVINLLKEGFINNFTKQSIYVLKSDCECRGVTPLISNQINQISDKTMISLCANAKQIISL